MIIQLRCRRRLHLTIEGPGIGRSQVIERLCRDCSRLASRPTVRREVFHRWDSNGVQLKDRVVRWERHET